MPGPLMARSAAPVSAPMQAPTEADIEGVVDTAANALSGVVDLNTPSGAYSPARLSTFRDALQACMDVLSPGTKLSFEPPPKSQGQRPYPMPRTLVEAYLTARSAYDAWTDSMEEEDEPSGMELPEPTSLTDDARIALAVQKLKALLADKSFAKWAKAQMAAAPAPRAAPRAQDLPSDPMTDELASLFGLPSRT